MSVQRCGVMKKGNKKQCLIKDNQPLSEEDANIDRISSLPKHVIDLILEYLPTEDAVRTCVLSSKWRYIWANSPTLVVVKEFWDSIKPKTSYEGSRVDFAVDTINRMFIHHNGHINECVLDISVVRSKRHRDVDLWLSLLSRRGVKELELENSDASTYALPSYVFSNSNLTYLSLYDGILKTVNSSTAINKLETLYLGRITLSSWVLVTPLLSSLTLESCRDTHHFIISAPRLVSLKLSQNDDLNLVPYLKCSDIEYAYIYVDDHIEHQRDGQKINVMKLLSCWPKISQFIVDGSSFEYLSTGIVPQEFLFKLSLTRLVLFHIDLNLDIDWIICILEKSPLLHRLEIFFCTPDDLELVNHLEETKVTNQMEQLRVVTLRYFNASRVELLFTKILLRSASSLERLLIEEDENLDPIERLRILKELTQLPRASSTAEIIFRPYPPPQSS